MQFKYLSLIDLKKAPFMGYKLIYFFMQFLFINDQ
jgi:hypothetical protein